MSDDAIEFTVRVWPNEIQTLWRFEVGGMKIDLDKIETVAKAAQANLMDSESVPWTVEEDDEAFFNVKSSSDEWVIGGANTGYVAEHIATCSPDVVLAMVARIRQAEEARDEALHECIRLMQRWEDR